MRSSRDNPGAYNSTHVRAPRAMAARAWSFVRQRELRLAALSVAVDAANLFEARFGRLLAKRYHCTCCGYEAHAFQHVLSGTRVRWNSACPRCNSRSRHRGLALLLPALLRESRPRRILHFAPEPVLQPCFAAIDASYETADLLLEDTTHVGVDVQSLRFADSSYDFIVCNHVIEHVPDDAAAIAQIARVLSASGVAVITVPGDFSRARTVEYTGTLPNGHYRDYGLDFIAKLEGSFGSVRAIDMHDLESAGSLSSGIRARDLVFVCSQPHRPS